MSIVGALYLENRLVHYELIGRRGPPVIFLHSWLGSWRYWLPTMEHLSERHRAFAMDFWGFGESDRREGVYSLTEYVTMLFDFMDRLGMTRAHLVGHGLGGMVAVRAAREQPSRFMRLVTVDTPLQGAQVQDINRSGGSMLVRLFGRSTPSNVWAKKIRDLSLEDDETYQALIDDTDSLSESLVQRVMTSVLETDLRQDIEHLTVPLLLVHGEQDSFVSFDPNAISNDGANFKQAVRIPKSSHFPFLDQPNAFNRLLVDFFSLDIQADGANQLEIKEEWRRRTSQSEYL